MSKHDVPRTTKEPARSGNTAMWKMLLLSLVCMVFGMLVVGGLLWHRDQVAHQERMERSLQAEANRMIPSLAPVLAANDTATIQALAEEAHIRSGMRVTVMAPDGTVLADTHEHPGEMDNHATRPEFLEAGESGVGSSIRFSDTLREDFLYVAIRVREAERVVGYVRTSMPQQDLVALFREEMRDAALFGVLAALGMLLLSLSLGYALSPSDASREARPIRWQLLLPLGAILILLVLGAAALLQTQHQRHRQEVQERLKQTIRESLFTDLGLQTEVLSMAAGMVRQTPSVAGTLRAEDGDALLQGWQETHLRLQREYGVTHFYFATPERIALARLHNPVHRGDRIDHRVLQEAVRTGRRVQALEADSLGILTLWVVQPVLDGESIRGFVGMGKDIEEVLLEKGRQFNAHFILSIPKAGLQRSDWETGMQLLRRSGEWDLLPDSVIQFSTLHPLPSSLSVFANHDPAADTPHGKGVWGEGKECRVPRDIPVGDAWWQLGVVPLTDVTGSQAGCLLVLTDVTEERTAYNRLLLRGSLLGGALLALLLAFIYTLLRRTDARIFAQQASLRESEWKLRVSLEETEAERLRARQEEALVKEVLGTISDAVILTDLDGRLTFICPNVKFIFGVPDEEIHLRGTISAILPCFHVDPATMTLGEERSNIEYPITRPDGTIRHLFINVKRIEIAAGQVLYTMRDITEHKHTLDELRRSEEHLRITLQSIGDAVIVTDIQGRVTTMNPVAESLTGWKGTEAKGKRLADVFRIVHARTRQPAFDPVAHVLRTGETVGLANHTLLLARDGTEYQIADSASPIRHPGGEVEGVLLVFRDVTEDYARREALQQSEARFRSFIENVNDVVYALTPEGLFTYVSPNWQEMMGEASETPIGKSFAVYVHPEDVHLCHEFLARTISTGEKQASVQYRVRHSNGTWRWHISNGSPIRDDTGTITQYIGIARDVTEDYARRDALQKSEARLQQAHEIAGMGHWDYHHAENRFEWSERTYALFGVDPDTFHPTYKSILGRIATEDRGPVDEAWQKALRQREPEFHADYRIVMNSGETRWIMEQCRIEYDPAGNPVHSIGIVMDITKRKQEGFFRELAHNVLDALTRSGDFNTAIQVVLRLLKESISCDAVGIRLEDHGDYPYFAQSGFSRDFLLKENSLVERDTMGEVCRNEDGSVCLQCTCGLVLSGKTDPDNPLFTPSGSCWTNNSFPLLDLPEEEDPRTKPRNECIHSQYASVALIPIRVASRIHGLLQLNAYRKGLFSPFAIQMLEEIAATIGHALMRIQVEEALRESEKKYRMLSELAMEGIWVIDAVGITTYVNPAMGGILGYTPEDMIGASVFDFMDEANKQDCRENMERRQRGIREVHEFTFRHKDGSPILVRMSTSPITEADDTYIGALALVTDITEERRTADNLRQMEKMSAVGQLAGGIAHNFNNQLTGVIGYAHMLLAKLEDPELKRYVENLLTGARRSAELTKQMLAFARMETTAPRDVDLHHLVLEVVTMISHSLPSNIRITQNLLAEPSGIHADPGQIQNAILNLAFNARDAMPDGGELLFETSIVELDAAYCATLPYETVPGTYLCLGVSDTGTGISPDVLPHIFEPFFTTKEVGQGTGMGLPTVYGTIKLHKGAITVYSEPGHGTTFRLYLPPGTTTDLQVIPPAPTLRAPYPATILLIDDEAIIRLIGEDMLSALGYTVVTKSDGAEGLAYFREHADTVDLVILDMVMPQMGGREVYRKMREIKPDVKVIIASGYTLNGEGMQILSEGVLGFVQKPFDRAALSTILHQRLENDRDG